MSSSYGGWGVKIQPVCIYNSSGQLKKSVASECRYRREERTFALLSFELCSRATFSLLKVPPV